MLLVIAFLFFFFFLSLSSLYDCTRRQPTPVPLVIQRRLRMPRLLATAIVNHIASLCNKKRYFFFVLIGGLLYFSEKAGFFYAHFFTFSVAYGVYQLKKLSDSFSCLIPLKHNNLLSILFI